MTEEHAPDSAAPSEVVADRRVGRRDLTRWTTTAGRAAARLATEVSRYIGVQRTLVLILAVGAGIAFVLAFLFARVYDAVSESDGISLIDRPILLAAIGLRSPVLDGLSATIADVFGTVGMPIIALVACLLLAVRRRSITPITLTVSAGLGSLLMTVAGKDIVDRHRPPLADAIPPFEYSASFPSGHTLNATVVLGVLAYLLILRRRSTAARIAIPVAAGVIVVAVGLSRVLLGAHWFTDVLAGWLLGAAWLAMVITAHRLSLTARRRRQEGTPLVEHAASRSGPSGGAGRT